MTTRRPVRSRRLLVALRALGLGDFLCGVPAYRALARAFPQHRRILALPRPLHPLVDLLDGAFDEAVDATPLGALPALGPVDVAVNLHGCGPQSHRVLLETMPRRLIAFAHSAVPASAHGPRPNPAEHEVQRWCRLLEHAGIAADPAQLGISIPTARAQQTNSYAVVHPGAASEARRWPPERWAAVVRALIARGECVVITGSSEERERVAQILALAGAPGIVDLAGRTTLSDLAALVARARCVIAGDTGIGHLASAYARPSVLLFGPTPPALWGPPPRAQHHALWAGKSGNPHAESIDEGLLTITPDDVVRTVDEVLRAVRE